jgi:hypothetical protein
MSLKRGSNRVVLPIKPKKRRWKDVGKKGTRLAEVCISRNRDSLFCAEYGPFEKNRVRISI